MTQLVYIGGYGHSGSTLLEYLMTASADVIACGEVASSRREWRRTRECSCGRLAEECPVWGHSLIQSFNRDHGNHADLDLVLLEKIANRYAIMVDSSKTAWLDGAAPFRLRRKLGQDFLLLHIVRDPRAVCWSLIKRSERLGERSNKVLLCAWTAFGWWFANLACELFRWMYPHQYHRIRYEDLARSPGAVLGSLLQELLPEGEWRFDAIGARDNRHQLYGNRMRSQRLTLADIKEDDTWRASMPTHYRHLIAPLSGVLRSRYGYS